MEKEHNPPPYFCAQPTQTGVNYPGPQAHVNYPGPQEHVNYPGPQAHYPPQTGQTTFTNKWITDQKSYSTLAILVNATNKQSTIHF